MNVTSQNTIAMDYQTYREIMDDLFQPIQESGLEFDTVRRLYESKILYLESLRKKCFKEFNATNNTYFSEYDYKIILQAIYVSQKHFKGLISRRVYSASTSQAKLLSMRGGYSKSSKK